ncbi:MAG: hypothetical protein AAGF20_03360 [Pseudomonadota bacterium]
MARFSPSDLEALDRLWRSIPADHVWTGWSASGDEPEEIVLYRTRAHWRKFPLRKVTDGFAVFDESGNEVARSKSLEGLLAAVEAIPGLMTDDSDLGST